MTVLLIELVRGVYKAHRGFAAVDDCHALKFVPHKAPDQRAGKARVALLRL